MSTETHSLQDTAPGDTLRRVDEAVCAFDGEWRFTFVNDRAAAMLEQPPADLLGNELWETRPDIEDSVVGEKLHEARETQTPVRFDRYSESLDKWFKIRLYPSEDGVTACFYDITDERRERLELRRQGKLFETVFEETGDALVVTDADRRITRFNPAAAEVFGYDESEVRGETAELLYPDGERQFDEEIPDSEETDTVEYERADGTTFEGETLVTSVGESASKTAAIVSIRDVSSRLAYERETEAHRDLLQTFHGIVTDEERTLEEQVESLIELGREHLGLAVGTVSRIGDERYTVEHARVPDGDVEDGDQYDPHQTCCEGVVETEGLVAVANADGDDRRHPAFGDRPLGSYVGVPVVVNDTQYGTLCFADTAARDTPFTEGERTFVRLLGQWLGKELSRQQSRERAAANRERLRQIIDMLPQLVFAKDRTGDYLLANEALADAYGTTVEELEGGTDADFASSPEEARQFREDDRAVIESGERKDIPEESLTTADGEERVMQTTKIPYDPVDHDTEAVLGVATDITELKERDAEIELQSEAMEVAMDGIAILDDDEYVYMNQTHAEIFGYEPEELVGSQWQRLYDESEIEWFESEVFPVLDEDGEWRGEAVGRRADGTLVYQDVGLSLLESGELICTNQDITERKEHEQELARQRTRLRALFDKSPDGIIIHDAEGAVVDANETVADNLGVEEETLLSMNVAEFEVGIDQSELVSIWDEMGKEETLKVEGEHRRDDGETFPVEVWVNRVDVDGTDRYIAVSRDITERKERERELKRSRDFVEQAQESASIGGWEVDLENDELRWTDEVYRIHDLPTDTAVALEDGIEFYHPEDRPTIQDAFERLTTAGESYDLELRLVTAEGAVRWVRTVGDPVVEDDEIVGVRGIFQDVTDRKEREQEFREVKERLDLAVEGANIGIWDWEMKTDTVTFNDQWAEMLGFSLSELDPHLETWENRVHPEDMADVEAQLEAHIAGETELYDCEHRMQTKSGEWRWIRDIGKVVERENGDPTRAVGIHLDITEQKESKLYLEEERDMFAQGPAIVFKWQNEEGWPVEYVSSNVTEAFGYTPAQLRSGKIPYTELIHDDDLDRVASYVDEQSDTTTDRFSHDPYRIVTSSGEVRWVTDNTKIIRHDGEITHYLGYLIDITEQKRLEASLRDSEQSLRRLTAIASDTNQSFEEKLDTLLELGTERLELPYGFLTRIDDETQHIVQAVGTHPDLQTGNTAPKSESYCRKTLQQDGTLGISDAVGEGWGQDPAYERFELGCYIGGTVVVDGTEYGTLCFADDTARPHSFDDAQRTFVDLLVQWISYELTSDDFETKLQQINDRARQLMAAQSRADVARITTESTNAVLDMSMAGIWWYDDTTNALVPERQTDEAKTVVGDQPAFEPGESLAWEAFNDSEVHVYDTLEGVANRHNESSELCSEVIVPLGEHGVVIASSTESGAFSETDLNLLEILSATVESALTRASREESLREARRELERSNEELEQFAYVASHDLQEPLRSVSSYLTLLERRYRDELDDDAVDFIDFAVDGADRMREMIQALLAYSRVDTQGRSFEPVDIAALFDRVTQNLETTIAETEATVSVPDIDATVVGDESQLTQLFQNLVENAIKYNEGAPHVDIAVTATAETARVEVTDDGIGIDPDQTEEIFEVFQRLHTREEFEGTGIGLSLCRKIVDRHGGSISVESEPGSGSTFVVTLPRGDTVDE